MQDAPPPVTLCATMGRRQRHAHVTDHARRLQVEAGRTSALVTSMPHGDDDVPNIIVAGEAHRRQQKPINSQCTAGCKGPTAGTSMLSQQSKPQQTFPLRIALDEMPIALGMGHWQAWQMLHTPARGEGLAEQDRAHSSSGSMTVPPPSGAAMIAEPADDGRLAAINAASEGCWASDVAVALG